LSRKHGAASDELPAICARLGADLVGLESQAEDIAAARQQHAACERSALTLAGTLTAARSAAARRLETRMVEELAVLGMRGARFAVHNSTAEDGAAGAALGPTGVDSIEFFLAANPGETPRPLARVASGGELSRIMLALKALTATVGETPILIFDEVDAG